MNRSSSGRCGRRAFWEENCVQEQGGVNQQELEGNQASNGRCEAGMRDKVGGEDCTAFLGGEDRSPCSPILLWGVRL